MDVSPNGLAREVVDGVLRLELRRPEKLNAVTTGLLEDLATELAAAGGDIRAVALTGAGRGFCAGADLTGPDGGVSLQAANAAVRAVRDAPVPVVALVQGPAAGVGCSLALACDLVLMARSGYLFLAFTRIGLMPDGGATALVAASIGRARALRMALLAERIPAETALEWGLVAGIYEDGDLREQGLALVRDLAEGATAAFALTKQAVNAATIGHLDAALEREAAGQARLGASSDFAEGVTAFREGREPRFTGRWTEHP